MAPTKLSVMNTPEMIIIYLNHKMPLHKKYIPPKVNTIEKKGSIIKKYFSFLGNEVVDTNKESRKKMILKESI